MNWPRTVAQRLYRSEPWSCLRDLLCLLPRWPRRRALEVAPAYWRKTLAEPEVQKRLSANPFRAITLRPDPAPTRK